MTISSSEQTCTRKTTSTFNEEVEVQIFARQMLRNRLFLGHYQERRYVDLLEQYRDVITLNKSEWDFARDLDIVKRRVANFYRRVDFWVGITGPDMIGAPASHCVWVKLQDLAFGCYWFQVKQVRFTQHNEMVIQVKCVRQMTDGEALPRPQTSHEASQLPVADQTDPRPDSSSLKTQWNIFASQWHILMTEDVAINLLTLFTVHNVKQALCFSVAVLVTLLTFVLRALAHVGEYSLGFIRELSNLIHVLTPIFLGLLDFIAKCVGGLYLLIAMLCRGNQAPPVRYQAPPVRYQHPALKAPPYYGNKL